MHAVPARDPRRRLHDGSRPRVEARFAFPSLMARGCPDPDTDALVVGRDERAAKDARREEERLGKRRLRDLGASGARPRLARYLARAHEHPSV